MPHRYHGHRSRRRQQEERRNRRARHYYDVVSLSSSSIDTVSTIYTRIRRSAHRKPVSFTVAGLTVLSMMVVYIAYHDSPLSASVQQYFHQQQEQLNNGPTIQQLMTLPKEEAASRVLADVSNGLYNFLDNHYNDNEQREQQQKQGMLSGSVMNSPTMKSNLRSGTTTANDRTLSTSASMSKRSIKSGTSVASSRINNNNQVYSAPITPQTLPTQTSSSLQAANTLYSTTPSQKTIPSTTQSSSSTSSYIHTDASAMKRLVQEASDQDLPDEVSSSTVNAFYSDTTIETGTGRKLQKDAVVVEEKPMIKLDYNGGVFRSEDNTHDANNMRLLERNEKPGEALERTRMKEAEQEANNNREEDDEEESSVEVFYKDTSIDESGRRLKKKAEEPKQIKFEYSGGVFHKNKEHDVENMRMLKNSHKTHRQVKSDAVDEEDNTPAAHKTKKEKKVIFHYDDKNDTAEAEAGESRKLKHTSRHYVKEEKADDSSSHEFKSVPDSDGNSGKSHYFTPELQPAEDRKLNLSKTTKEGMDSNESGVVGEVRQYMPRKKVIDNDADEDRELKRIEGDNESGVVTEIHHYTPTKKDDQVETVDDSRELKGGKDESAVVGVVETHQYSPKQESDRDLKSETKSHQYIPEAKTGSKTSELVTSSHHLTPKGDDTSPKRELKRPEQTEGETHQYNPKEGTKVANDYSSSQETHELRELKQSEPEIHHYSPKQKNGGESVEMREELRTLKHKTKTKEKEKEKEEEDEDEEGKMKKYENEEEDADAEVFDKKDVGEAEESKAESKPNTLDNQDSGVKHMEEEVKGRTHEDTGEEAKGSGSTSFSSQRSSSFWDASNASKSLKKVTDPASTESPALEGSDEDNNSKSSGHSDSTYKKEYQGSSTSTFFDASNDASKTLMETMNSLSEEPSGFESFKAEPSGSMQKKEEKSSSSSSSSSSSFWDAGNASDTLNRDDASSKEPSTLDSSTIESSNMSEPSDFSYEKKAEDEASGSFSDASSDASSTVQKKDDASSEESLVADSSETDSSSSSKSEPDEVKLKLDGVEEETGSMFTKSAKTTTTADTTTSKSSPSFEVVQGDDGNVKNNSGEGASFVVAQGGAYTQSQVLEEEWAPPPKLSSNTEKTEEWAPPPKSSYTNEMKSEQDEESSFVVQQNKATPSLQGNAIGKVASVAEQILLQQQQQTDSHHRHLKKSAPDVGAATNTSPQEEVGTTEVEKMTLVQVQPFVGQQQEQKPSPVASIRGPDSIINPARWSEFQAVRPHSPDAGKKLDGEPLYSSQYCDEPKMLDFNLSTQGYCRPEVTYIPDLYDRREEVWRHYAETMHARIFHKNWEHRDLPEIKTFVGGTFFVWDSAASAWSDEGSSMEGGEGWKAVPEDKDDLMTKYGPPIVLEDAIDYVAYTSWYEGLYGHYFDDHLPSIAYLKASVPASTKFLLLDTKLARDVLRFLDPAFYQRVKWIPMHKPVKVGARGTLLVSRPLELPLMVGCCRPYDFLRHWITTRLPPTTGGHSSVVVYYSRQSKRTHHGRKVDPQLEEEIIHTIQQAMKQYNRPEERLVVFTGEDEHGNDLGIEEQYKIFRSAKTIIGPHGAGMLGNLVWTNPLPGLCERRVQVLEFIPSEESTAVQPAYQSLFLRWRHWPAEFHTLLYTKDSTKDTTYIRLHDLRDALEGMWGQRSAVVAAVAAAA